MKKLLNFLLVFLLSSALFAGGCFFTKNEQGGDDNIEKEAFELDPNKEYYIEFMMWGAADEVDNYTALVDSFMDEYENITVNITPADSTQYMSILTASFRERCPIFSICPNTNSALGWTRGGCCPLRTDLPKRNMLGFGPQPWIGIRITARPSSSAFPRGRIYIVCQRISARGR